MLEIIFLVICVCYLVNCDERDTFDRDSQHDYDHMME